jgi:ACDE family multidrug resistance protein
VSDTSDPRPLLQDPNLYIVLGVALMAVLRADSVTPAFPALTRALDLPPQSAGLLITLYALPSVFLAPVLGVLADRWGRKRVLVPSLLLFGVAGAACALAPTFEILLALRFLHGIGAAALSMLNVTLIADLYTGARRSAAMGYNASARSGGSTVYPLLGGALAALGWRWPFVLALLALPVALLVWFALDNPEPRSRTRLVEYLGGTWQTLRQASVVGLFGAGWAVFVVMYGAYMPYFPFVLEDRFALSPVAIGLMISGRAAVNAVIAAQLGWLTRRWSERTLLKTSFALYALAMALIPLAPTVWAIVGITLLLGIAEGLYWPSNHVLLGQMAPLAHRAGFIALNDAVLKLGQTLGPLLIAGVYALGGVPGAFAAAAACAVAALVLTILLLKE